MLVPDLTEGVNAEDRFGPAIQQASVRLMKEWQGMKRTPSSLDLSKQPKPSSRGGNVIVVAGPEGGDADKMPRGVFPLETPAHAPPSRMRREMR